MRTSLNEITEIENYLDSKADAADSLVFEAKMLAQPQLRLHVHLQRKISRLVQLFHRKKTKQDLQKIHQQLFADPEKAEFQQKILHLFNS
jgi:hypothetical protein